jgi:hypothetical protein
LQVAAVDLDLAFLRLEQFEGLPDVYGVATEGAEGVGHGLSTV